VCAISSLTSTFAISSPDEFLCIFAVTYCILLSTVGLVELERISSEQIRSERTSSRGLDRPTGRCGSCPGR